MRKRIILYTGITILLWHFLPLGFYKLKYSFSSILCELLKKYDIILVMKHIKL